MASTTDTSIKSGNPPRAPASSSALPRESRKVTPPGKSLTSLDKALAVDKDVVDELLLICGVIGSSDSEGHLVPVSDCLEWLQDLQRALRRDDDLFRPISLLLGKWKIVQDKLFPLVRSSPCDTPLLLTIAKILVILTKPLAETTLRAGTMMVDPKKQSERYVDFSSGIFLQRRFCFFRFSHCDFFSVAKQQIKLRENALAQATQLVQLKQLFCRKKGVLSIFVSMLAEPLSKSSRSDQDHLTIELILHLFRNLLAADPILSHSVAESQELHFELIQLLQEEQVLNILLVIAADIEQRENAQYNLLVLELMHQLFRHVDPTAVATVHNSQTPQQKSNGKLTQLITREKQAYSVPLTSRHGHFGGTLVSTASSTSNHSERRYVSTTTLFGKNKHTQPAAVKTRKNRKAEPFVGMQRSLQYSSQPRGSSSPLQRKAHLVLHEFCQRLLTEAYGPLAKSLKNEFRRDSVRLEDNDRHLFFRILWFLSQFWRSCDQKAIDTKASTSIGQFIFTMDIFTFNLVLNSTDTYQQFKQYPKLAGAVSLLSEMMHMLYMMYSSKDKTEELMAMGLMDRLFYGKDPIDRLPLLFSKWEPSTLGREYVCDLVEICHVQMKLLEAHAKECENLPDPKRIKYDTLLKMKANAAAFSFESYFNRKLVSNQIIHMYTQLLAQYVVNAPTVNNRIVMYLRRVSKVKIAVPETTESLDMPQNPLITKTVTLEPSLYNISLFIVINKILNDQSLRGQTQHKPLLDFCVRFVSNFSKMSLENPMLFVEILFKPTHLGRFCDNVVNSYITEECRMIAERRLLLEENERFEKQIEKVRNDDSGDEDEIEFEDFGISAAAVMPSKSRKRKAVIDESDNEDEEENERSDESGESRPARSVADADAGRHGSESEERKESVDSVSLEQETSGNNVAPVDENTSTTSIHERETFSDGEEVEFDQDGKGPESSHEVEESQQDDESNDEADLGSRPAKKSRLVIDDSDDEE